MKLPTFFINNPRFKTTYTGIGPSTRMLYEFGALPVAVNDASDAERFRSVQVEGMFRLIETDRMGKPLVMEHMLEAQSMVAPRSVVSYRGDMGGVPQPQAPARRAQAPDETFTRQVGVQPPGMTFPTPAQAALQDAQMSRGADDDEDDDEEKGPRKVIRRTARSSAAARE